MRKVWVAKKLVALKLVCANNAHPVKFTPAFSARNNQHCETSIAGFIMSIVIFIKMKFSLRIKYDIIAFQP